MRLPKRVPWANIDELQTVFQWIYGENSDNFSREKAIRRLSAWRVATALPNALESTLSILSVCFQDENDFSKNRGMSLNLRQSYSLALIRFVNGLVDPLQSGVFARPIVSIAAQIGIPLWMVELRHAGTHEDLPSLEVLREGAKEAMNWLLYNYFLPTISPHAQTVENLKLPSLSPLLLRYKQMSKATTRDVTLKSSSKTDMAKILRGFDQWLAEASVVASRILHPSSREEEVEEKERWSLSELADRLIDRGGLVPVAKRKRTQPNQRLAGPPAEYISIWTPLLSHVQSNHPTFLNILLSRILSYLISDRSEAPSDGTLTNGTNHSDLSYDFTLASWVLWVVDNYQNVDEADINLDDILREFLLGLGRRHNNATKALVFELSQRHERLKGSGGDIISALIREPGSKPSWNDNSLQIMSERLSALRPANKNTSLDIDMPVDHEGSKDMVVDSVDTGTIGDSSDEAVEMPGWRRLGEVDGWKPVPIGVFYPVINT